MLEKLDTIQWGELEHAYGDAGNIPERLRAIIRSRGTEQEAAIDAFANDICHQASAYSATAPCVPFLCEIIANRRIPRRDRLVSLLLTIAVGLDSDMLLSHKRMIDFISEQEVAAANWPEDRKRTLSWGPFILLDTYFAVEKIIPFIVTLLSDPSRLVRIHAMYLLAWFPRKRRQILRHMRTVLSSVKRWDELANAILSIGVLEWQSGIQPTLKKSVRQCLLHHRQEVRYAAAIYLSWDRPANDTQALMVELSEREEYDYGPKIPFNGYCWSTFASCWRTRMSLDGA